MLNQLFNLACICAYGCIKLIGLLLFFIGEMLNDRSGLLLPFCIFLIHEFLYILYFYNSNKNELPSKGKNRQFTTNQTAFILTNIILALFCIYAWFSLISVNGISSCGPWGIIMLYQIILTEESLRLNHRFRRRADTG